MAGQGFGPKRGPPHGHSPNHGAPRGPATTPGSSGLRAPRWGCVRARDRVPGCTASPDRHAWSELAHCSPHRPRLSGPYRMAPTVRGPRIPPGLLRPESFGGRPLPRLPHRAEAAVPLGSWPPSRMPQTSDYPATPPCLQTSLPHPPELCITSGLPGWSSPSRSRGQRRSHLHRVCLPCEVACSRVPGARTQMCFGGGGREHHSACRLTSAGLSVTVHKTGQYFCLQC